MNIKKIVLLLIFAFSAVSCQAQKVNLKLDWKEFVSKEAGIKVSLPCEPKRSYKSFQDEPRPIHVYEFDCEAEGMIFLFSFKNHLDNFDEKITAKTFEASESNLKFMFGKVEKFVKKDNFQINGRISRFYEIYPENGGKINNLIVVDEEGTYEASIGVTPENAAKLKAKMIDFDVNAKKFIDSFQITKDK